MRQRLPSGFQNASPIENDLSRLAVFRQLGVRIIGAVSFPIFLRKGYDSTLGDFADADPCARITRLNMTNRRVVNVMGVELLAGVQPDTACVATTFPSKYKV